MAVADLLARTPASRDGVRLTRTSLGLGISRGSVSNGDRAVDHYSLSHLGRPLRPHDARALEGLALCSRIVRRFAVPAT